MRHSTLRILIFIFVITFHFSVFAQNSKYIISEDKSKVSLVVDYKKTRLTIADIQQRGKNGHPLPEAKLYALNINADTIGLWSGSEPEGRKWILNIAVPKAKGFFVSFDDFYLPEGSRLYVYDKEKPNEAMVFRHNDNPNGGAYSVEDLLGDNVVFEYVASKGNEKPRFHLLNIGYKYVDDNTGKMEGLNHLANKCMVNINCKEGDEWQDQKRGVLRLRMNRARGSALCSGTLINNTNNDKTPYVLTAQHCFENMTIEEIENTEFFFDYEFPSCENSQNQPAYKYHKGAEVLVLNSKDGGSDGALLRITGEIPSDWDVFFNGWNRNNSVHATTSGAVLHHPRGDVKKITLYDKSPTSGKWNDNFSAETHWITVYSLGVTDEGSSGSPMFNQDKLVIGTLTGGYSSCSNLKGEDYYGKFWYHWDQYSDVNNRMNKYLDPKNQGLSVCPGINNNDDADKSLVIENSVLAIKLGVSKNVRILSGNGGYSLSIADESIASATLDGSKIIITAKRHGTTKITVRDKKKKEVDVVVSVRKDIEVFADKSNNNLIVNISDNDGDKIKQVRIMNISGLVLINKKGLEVDECAISMSYLKKGPYIIETKTKKGKRAAETIIWQK